RRAGRQRCQHPPEPGVCDLAASSDSLRAALATGDRNGPQPARDGIWITHAQRRAPRLQGALSRRSALARRGVSPGHGLALADRPLRRRLPASASRSPRRTPAAARFPRTSLRSRRRQHQRNLRRGRSLLARRLHRAGVERRRSPARVAAHAVAARSRNLALTASFQLDTQTFSNSKECVMARSTSTSTSGRNTDAPRDAIALLKQDHRTVSALFEEFEKADEEEQATIAQRVCQLLTVHAQIEEELLYPAAKEAFEGEEEDEVEHGSAKELIAKIEGMSSGDEHFKATVTVLGEYIKHHVKEEESELF